MCWKGKTYAVYLPHGGSVTIKLEAGRYRAFWFSAVSGEMVDLPPVEGLEWKSPDAPDQNDWALLLRAM